MNDPRALNSSRKGEQAGRSSWRETSVLLLRFLRYFAPYRRSILIGCVCMFAGLALSLVQPIISKAIIDDALITRNLRLLNFLGVAFLATALLSYLFSTVRQYVFTVVQQRVMTTVRKKLTEHILHLPMSFHDRQNPGYLMARADSDVGNLAGVMTDRYVQTLVDLLMLLGATLMLFAMNWRLALLAISTLPFFTWSVVHFGRRIRALSYENQEKHALVAAKLQDIFHSAFIIKVFARELGETRLLLRSLNQFVRSNMKVTTLGLLSNLTMGCIATLAPLAVIWYGGHEVIAGRLSVGSLFAFNMYLAYLFTPLKNIYGTSQSVQASAASLQRVFELFDRPGEAGAGTGSPAFAGRSGTLPPFPSIEFRNVSFSYAEREQPVLQDVSFRIEPETTVALVGPSGAGKSTIFSLLLRLYECGSGKILVDGVDLRDLDLRGLRKQIRLVPQDPYLFNRSIADNIRFGAPEASPDQVLASAVRAHVDDFVSSLPAGYDAVVGQRGTMLSAGERQRLSIARALVSNPSVLLLDEATAFLDSNTEADVQEAIYDSTRGRTCLVIAHRLSTVVNADQIMVLDQGGIVAQGSHRELYSECPLYRSYFDKQFRNVTVEEAGTAHSIPAS
ncbi:MAG TPA: ABC transporter ATP-binding protein [Candidatus Angelobacter sp.]